MTTKSGSTRDRLIDTGRRLFATGGIYRVALKEIVGAAGQRNTSALHYHFGGREGLLAAIIAVHNEEIEAERAELLESRSRRGLADDLPSLVTALVLPYSRALEQPDGREYLQIIAQMAHLFDAWDTDDAPHFARQVFVRIEALLGDLPPAVSHQRVTTFLSLVTHSLAGRARQLDSSHPPALAHEPFVDDLVAMSVGALQAPAGSPVSPAVVQAGGTQPGSTSS